VVCCGIILYVVEWCSLVWFGMPAMQCYVMLCYAMLCYAMLCYAMLCYAMLCYAMLCYAIYAMLCYAMLCNAMLCNAMQCYAMLFAAIAVEGEQNAVDHCGNDGNFLPYSAIFILFTLHYYFET
jgi:hypothetical protein